MLDGFAATCMACWSLSASRSRGLDDFSGSQRFDARRAVVPDTLKLACAARLRNNPYILTISAAVKCGASFPFSPAGRDIDLVPWPIPTTNQFVPKLGLPDTLASRWFLRLGSVTATRPCSHCQDFLHL